jgi:hypothetical protein
MEVQDLLFRVNLVELVVMVELPLKVGLYLEEVELEEILTGEVVVHQLLQDLVQEVE